MGARKERKAFREFIEASIANRRAWADSEECIAAFKEVKPNARAVRV